MITVEFKDFNDMLGFAHELVNGYLARQEKQKEESISETKAVTAAVPSTLVEPVVPGTSAMPMPIASVTSANAAAPEPFQHIVPTNTPEYTLDDLAAAAMTLMDAGRQNDLIGLLAQFGVDALPALPKTQYGAFATALRGMGAKI